MHMNARITYSGLCWRWNWLTVLHTLCCQWRQWWSLYTESLPPGLTGCLLYLPLQMSHYASQCGTWRTTCLGLLVGPTVLPHWEGQGLPALGWGEALDKLWGRVKVLVSGWYGSYNVLASISCSIQHFHDIAPGRYRKFYRLLWTHPHMAVKGPSHLPSRSHPYKDTLWPHPQVRSSLQDKVDRSLDFPSHIDWLDTLQCIEGGHQGVVNQC